MAKWATPSKQERQAEHQVPARHPRVGGLNDYIKKEAAAYAQEMPGVNVLALDPYDGQADAHPVEHGHEVVGDCMDAAGS